MAWKYENGSGTLSLGDYAVVGYSGFGPYRNQPSSEGIKHLGVIPRGRYYIGKPYDSPNVGPFAIPLEALPGTEVFGRGDFRIHGDSIGHPGLASHGCIVVERSAREKVAASDDKVLEVV